MKKNIEIIIVDDKLVYHKLIKDILLNSTISIMNMMVNGKMLLEYLKLCKPNIILMDIENLTLEQGKILEKLHFIYPEIRIIVMSCYSEEVLIENILKRGVQGFLSKPDFLNNANILEYAINKVFCGEIYVHKNNNESVRFSYRQKQVLFKMLANKTSQEIAEDLGISKRAVEKHRSNIYFKTKSLNKVDFFKFAFTSGFQFLIDEKNLGKGGSV